MNENPGGSPNPLNPDPNVGPDPNNSPQNNNPESIEVEQQVQVSESVEADPLAQATAGLNTDPTMRPMEKAPVAGEPQPPKKKKTGLIVGAIVAAVLLCGGIIAAIIALSGNKGDAVAQALKKLTDGNIPANVAVDGTINIVPKSNNSMITGLSVAVKSEAATKSMLNSTSVKLTATFQEGETASFEVDEMYASNGDLYLKVDGLADAIRDYSNLSAITTNGSSLEEGEADCVEDEDGVVDCEVEELETNCVGSEDMNCEEEVTTTTIVADDDVLDVMEEFAGVAEYLDGEWLRISTEELSQMTSGMSSDNEAACLMNLVSDANQNNNSLAGAYSSNPFIASTTEGVTVASKSGSPVYKVTFDSEKLEGFVNAVQESEVVRNYYSCMGSNGAKINTNELKSELSKLPDLYVEVDNDYNFTRFYFTMDAAENQATVTTDFGLSYPVNINVAEPAEYTDLTDLIQEIMSGMTQSYIVEDTEVTY